MGGSLGGSMGGSLGGSLCRSGSVCATTSSVRTYNVYILKKIIIIIIVRRRLSLIVQENLK